jgi:hypothetical protein
VLIYTDHKTLENFDTQRDLSRHQARWMEFLSQYDFKIMYIKGMITLWLTLTTTFNVDVVDP